PGAHHQRAQSADSADGREAAFLMTLMRRTLAILGFAALLTAAFLAAQKPQESLVHEIAPGLFYWKGDEIKRVQTNVGWAIFQDYVVVIDANFPWGAREILPEIKKTTSKPIRFVFDTHYHADHSYGNVVFQAEGATIVSSAASQEEAQTKGWRDAQNQAKDRATDPLIHPTLVFPDKMTFDDGQQRVELIVMGPAHTKGDTVAYLPKAKVLFVGDLAVNWIYGNNVSDVDADLHHWVQVLGQLSEWDVKTVIPGHGVPGDVATLRGQRDYLRDMLQQV